MTDQIADYELVGALGRSASGMLHLALPPRRLRTDADLVVVKILVGRHPRERFPQVAETLRLFTAAESRHLATLYEVGYEHGAIWLSMEHYTRGSLQEPTVPLTRQELLQAVACASRGAHALHEVGLVHGDIKPANVLLATEGARLADVGLRASLHPNMTLPATSALADVELIDPTVIRGESPTRASDIWSLGVTLHRALSGEGLYPRTPEDDVLRVIRRVASTRPEIHSSLTVEEASLVRACLSVDPTERPPTGDVLAKTIEGLL